VFFFGGQFFHLKKKREREFFSSVNLTNLFLMGLAKDKIYFSDWLIIMIGHGDDI
jgi:hypothetical protein